MASCSFASCALVAASAFACATAEQLAVNRTGTTAVDAFALPVPIEHRFGTGIALDHPFGVVIGVMGEGFQRQEITGVDFQQRCEVLAEITPMHRLG